jgi:hypothetical protein
MRRFTENVKDYVDLISVVKTKLTLQGSKRDR